MQNRWISIALICFILLAPFAAQARYYDDSDDDEDSTSLPAHIAPPGEKVVIVDPHIHLFGAYDADGTLLHSGTATAGRDYCADIGKPCRTKIGTFRVFSAGSRDCISHKFPVRTHGGAPMPYCMYFNNGQALHGVHEGEVARANLSHGCVRLHVWDAKWLRFNFVEEPSYDNNYHGTKVIIRHY